MTIISSLKNITIPYGVLHTRKKGIITSIEEKPRLSYFINTGVYIVNPEFLEWIPEGKVLIMAAIESARGVMRAMEICEASERLFGIALSGGDYTKDLHTHITGTGIELMGARQNMVIAARATGVQCFDTVYTDLDNMEGFRQDVETIHLMGFDGKSIVNPRQINIVHEIFTPSEKEIIFSEKVVREIDRKRAEGIGVFTVDGKMIDIAFYDGAKRTIELAKASGVYKGDL